MKELLLRLVREEEGQDLVEYALLAAVAASNTLGETLSERYDPLRPS